MGRVHVRSKNQELEMTDTVNPPAFPTATLAQKTEGGMLLLDYMAAKAMQSLIREGFKSLGEMHKNNTDAINPTIAQASYEMADAMLKERTRWIK